LPLLYLLGVHDLPLFDVKHQAFEVFTLGMIDVYGVVGRLMELVKDA
jgi:hypothetical protein